jgi:hypothetical protein
MVQILQLVVVLELSFVLVIEENRDYLHPRPLNPLAPIVFASAYGLEIPCFLNKHNHLLVSLPVHVKVHNVILILDLLGL